MCLECGDSIRVDAGFRKRVPLRYCSNKNECLYWAVCDRICLNLKMWWCLVLGSAGSKIASTCTGILHLTILKTMASRISRLSRLRSLRGAKFRSLVMRIHCPVLSGSAHHYSGPSRGFAMFTEFNRWALVGYTFDPYCTSDGYKWLARVGCSKESGLGSGLVPVRALLLHVFFRF